MEIISVCMATYNGAKYLKVQVDSILQQLGPEDELIVSDDGSTDGTIEILNSYKDSRIKIYRHDRMNCKYTGKLKECFWVGRNFENALLHTRGEYVFLSDQDDLWLPGKIDCFLDQLKTSDLVISDCKVVDSELNEISESYLNKTQLRKYAIAYIFKSRFLGCCMAMRRTLIKYALPFPHEPVLHDIWLLLMGTHYGKCKQIATSTLLYRRHGLNVSCGSEKSSNSLMFKISFRLLLLKAYLSRVLFSHK